MAGLHSKLVAREGFALNRDVAVDDSPKPNHAVRPAPTLPPVPGKESPTWFAEAVLPHESALRGYLRARFSSLPDVDDLVQESYLRMFKAHASAPIVSPKAFLFATARNLALNLLRHRRHSRNVLGETDLSVVLDESAGVCETVARAQEIRILHDAIQSLPERCRQIFTLRRIYGLSTKEVAARLGLSEKTVEAQCIIALRKCVIFFRRAEAPAALRARANPLAPPPAGLPASQLEFRHG